MVIPGGAPGGGRTPGTQLNVGQKRSPARKLAGREEGKLSPGRWLAPDVREGAAGDRVVLAEEDAHLVGLG